MRVIRQMIRKTEFEVPTDVLDGERSVFQSAELQKRPVAIDLTNDEGAF